MTIEYIDYRGRRYKVKSGIGCNIFKARCFKPGKECSSGKGVTVLPWRNSIEEAQADLDEYAHKHKMTVADIT